MDKDMFDFTIPMHPAGQYGHYDDDDDDDDLGDDDHVLQGVVCDPNSI